MADVHIEITSTLTLEDESRMASAVLKALSGLLDMLPIAYLVRIETTDEQVLQHAGPRTADWNSVGALVNEPARPVTES